MTRPAVFLDRDGVLVDVIVRGNQAYAPLTLDEFHVTPRVGDHVARLRDAGLVPIVFTNQPEVARGLLDLDVLETMHQQLRHVADVTDILVCPHDGDDSCDCRKPKPGMLHQAAHKWGLDLLGSYVIGDRWRDIEAGRAAGCFTVLLQRPYSACSTADANVDSLDAAVDVVLARLKKGTPWTT
jgi:D-glycero-D-manno-heptose 1,7-bisphosphate phosphatase